jgi:hypothetical protein
LASRGWSMWWNTPASPDAQQQKSPADPTPGFFDDG